MTEQRLTKYPGNETIVSSKAGVTLKYFEDYTSAAARVWRANRTLKDITPKILRDVKHWFVYEYVQGIVLSDIDDEKHMKETLTAILENAFKLWRSYQAKNSTLIRLFIEGYIIERTATRLRLRGRKRLAFIYEDWMRRRTPYLIDNAYLSYAWHGDFSLDNLILGSDGTFYWIDWNGEHVGDVYFDLAKIVKSAHFDPSTCKAHSQQDVILTVLYDLMRSHAFDPHTVNIYNVVVMAKMVTAHPNPYGELFARVTEKLIESCDDVRGAWNSARH